MQKRTFTRAAGVSPPWLGFALATATRFCALITFRTAQSLPVPRLAHASRSCLRDVCSASKSDICDAQTNVHKSGGRQPAVGRIRACNRDPLLRTDYVSHRTVASRTTAGSRQPLLVHEVCSV